MSNRRDPAARRAPGARRLIGGTLLAGPLVQPTYKSIRAVAEAQTVRRERAAVVARLDRPEGLRRPLRFYLLLPAFRAVEDVEDAYRWFRRLAVPDAAEVQIVFITTDRDGPEDDNTTAAAVRRLLAAAGPEAPIVHIHSRRRPYSKAAQLNEAVARLPVDDPMTTYYFVFDIDGRPERRALEITAQLIGEDLPPLAQQIALTVGSPVGGTTALSRVDAVLHLCRAFHHESRRWRRSASRPIRPGCRAVADAVGRPCVYCVGNGLLVQAAALQRIGGFPEPVDDLGVGFRASYLGIPVRPLPVFVHQAMYRNVASMTSSKRFIFSGIVSAFRELPDPKGPSAGERVLAAKAMLPAVTWVAFPGALVLGALIQPWPLSRRGRVLGVVAALASVPPALAGWIIKGRIGEVTADDESLPAQQPVSAADLALAPVELFVNAAGPCSYLWRRLVTA